MHLWPGESIRILTEYNTRNATWKTKQRWSLFNYRGLLEATIWDRRWRFLFMHHGLQGSIDFDRQSGWSLDQDLGEWISSTYCQALMVGLNPLNVEFGDCLEDRGVFVNVVGVEPEIYGKIIYSL